MTTCIGKFSFPECDASLMQGECSQVLVCQTSSPDVWLKTGWESGEAEVKFSLPTLLPSDPTLISSWPTLSKAFWQHRFAWDYFIRHRQWVSFLNIMSESHWCDNYVQPGKSLTMRHIRAQKELDPFQ